MSSFFDEDLFWSVTVNFKDDFQGNCFKTLFKKIVEYYALEESYPEITAISCHDDQGDLVREAHDKNLQDMTMRLETEIDEWLIEAQQESDGQKAIEREFRASIALN